jgi:hypothetical protein
MDSTFETPGRTTIRVSIPAGRVSMRSGATAQTRIRVRGLDEGDPDAPRVEADRHGEESVIMVEAPESRRLWRRRDYHVDIDCPDGSSVEASTASADVEGLGRFGEVRVNTASGDVRLGRVGGELRFHAASGDLAVEEVDGRVDAKTASGDVRVGRAGDEVRVTTASGDVRVAIGEGAVHARTASGDQTVEVLTAGPVWMDTVSGDLSVGIVPGVDVWLDLQSLSGNTVSELSPSEAPARDTGEVVEIRMRSLSGDLRIHRAKGPAPVAHPPRVETSPQPAAGPPLPATGMRVL